MNNLFLKGCSTALVTPFLEDGSVDYDSYAALLDRQVASGADFLTVLATTAETPTLSLEEKQKLLAISKEHCGGLPLLVGCGSNSVAATLENIRQLPGADAYLVVVPFYNKPTQEGMYLYFKAIAEAAPAPVVIYNVPGRTGANMLASTALRLAREVSGIIGIKEASGKMDQCREIIDGAPQGFSVLSGDDDMTFELIQAGGNGVISVASNALPAEVSRMCHLALEGRFPEASALNDKLLPLMKGCFIESNPIPVKAALAELGLCRASVRLPLTEATEQTKHTIREILKEWK
ncbi:MAG: 4-hydroxy-tetrahydrodipicolinate synthase [Candidatus Cryptobacteroides sp.]